MRFSIDSTSKAFSAFAEHLLDEMRPDSGWSSGSIKSSGFSRSYSRKGCDLMERDLEPP